MFKQIFVLWGQRKRIEFKSEENCTLQSKIEQNEEDKKTVDVTDFRCKWRGDIFMKQTENKIKLIDWEINSGVSDNLMRKGIRDERRKAFKITYA